MFPFAVMGHSVTSPSHQDSKNIEMHISFGESTGIHLLVLRAGSFDRKPMKWTSALPTDHLPLLLYLAHKFEYTPAETGADFIKKNNDRHRKPIQEL